MSTVHPPNQAPPPVLKAPYCPVCGKTMRLESSVPNLSFVNLDQLKFICDCGQTAEKIIGR